MKLPWTRIPPRLDDDQADLLINATTTALKRSLDNLYGISHNGKRDLVKIYGYPEPGDLCFDYFLTQYKMNGVANRIASMPPRSCWRDGAFLAESDDENAEVILAEEMRALGRAGLFRELEKADILNRLGQFSVMYIGLPDNNDLTKPVGKGGGSIEDIYFAAFSEASVTISKYDTDKTSKRFGLPEIYTLTPGATGTGSNKAADTRQPIKAHWSRVVHLAEGALDNGVYGIPVLQPIINRCLDLDKTVGGAAEAFFRNAAQKMVMAIDKEATITPEGMTAFQADVEKFVNQMQNIIGAKGSKISALAVQTADPGPVTATAWEFIAGYTGISRRIWTGDGSGQYTGNEDKASFNQIISDRQQQECTGWLEQALTAIDSAGLIKMPEDYIIGYPVPTAMDEKTSSEVALNRARAAQAVAGAIQAYAMTPGAESMIPPESFRRAVLELDIEELEKITLELTGVSADGDGDLEDEE